MNRNAVILIPCLLTGGTEVATLDTAKALVGLGFTVTVLVYFDETDPAMLDAFHQAGIAVHLLGLPRLGGIKGALRLGIALASHLSLQRPTLVWAQYMTPTLVPLVIARFFTRQLVAAVHVAARHYSPGGLRRLRWLASWWCNRLVCVSHTTANGILGERPVTRLQKSVCVIPNTLDMQAVVDATPHNWRRQLGISPQQPIIGFVGRLATNKGVDILLQAAARINREHPDTHWVIAGNGVEKAALQQQAAAAGLEGKVHFTGSLPRDAVYGAMKGFDIAVVPSREEGFGLTALEAMACGVPLVASRVDALHEVVKDGETGMLFTVEDAQELAETIQHLLASDSLRTRLANAAAAHAQATYGQEQLMDQIRLMLNDLVEEGRIT